MLSHVESSLARTPDADRIDQRVTLHGITWDEYEAFLAMRGESSALRVTYLEGELEIMAPSRDHENLKTRLARLVEAWAEETDRPLEGAGSWTVRKRAKERGAEADECYFVLGERDDRPDIAIEVVWTSGGISKLEVWRGLGVPEVWIWEKGALSFHILAGEHYVETSRSVLLPAFDPALIQECMRAASQTDAVKQLRSALRARP
jgi:Uma2 family endonuclease